MQMPEFWRDVPRDYKKYLLDTAIAIGGLLCKYPCAKELFSEQVSRFVDMEKEHRTALDTMGDSNRDKPIPATADLPPTPLAWLPLSGDSIHERFSTKYERNGLIIDLANMRKPTGSEVLMCQYWRLAVLHDVLAEELGDARLWLPEDPAERVLYVANSEAVDSAVYDTWHNMVGMSISVVGTEVIVSETARIRVAMQAVRANIEAAEKPTSQVPEALGQSHDGFLEGVANEIEGLVLDERVRAVFQEQMARLCRTVEDYGAAIQPYDDALEKTKERFDKNGLTPAEKGMRIEHINPRTGKNEMTVAMDKLCPPPKGWVKGDRNGISMYVNTTDWYGIDYRPESAANPLLWFWGGRSGCRWHRQPNEAEKLMVEYVLLGLIHDWKCSQATDRKVFDQKPYAGRWFRFDEFRQAVVREHDKGMIERALIHVKADIRARAAESPELRISRLVEPDCQKNETQMLVDLRTLDSVIGQCRGNIERLTDLRDKAVNLWEEVRDTEDPEKKEDKRVEAQTATVRLAGELRAYLDRERVTAPAMAGNSRTRGDEAVDLAAVWSKPMSKTNMMAVTGIDDIRKFNAWANRHGIEMLTRKIYRIRLDLMDAPTRQKFEEYQAKGLV